MLKVGRKDKVKLIAVTKTQELQDVKDIIELGINDIGENKVQDMVKRVED